MSRAVIFFILFLYSLPLFSRTVIVSDIDDTIKKANSMGKVAGMYHFLRAKPYLEMRDIFQNINEYYSSADRDGVAFYYVSAASKKLFKAKPWLLKYKFPMGPAILKAEKEDTYDYKYRIIKNILNEEMAKFSDVKFLFFGDNAKYDQKVYSDLRNELKLNDAEIFIRDVKANATYFTQEIPTVKLPNVNYFFSEIELLNEFNFLDNLVVLNIRNQYEEQKLIPLYTFTTLTNRLVDMCKNHLHSCQHNAKKMAHTFWNDYYTRY